MKSDNRHYAALVAESKRAGWPERFATDLTVHDRAALARRDPSLPFAWVLRTDGTYILYAGPPDQHGNDPVNLVRLMPDTFGADRCRFYWWDGVSLRESSVDDLCEILRDAADKERAA
jgi:hypothetical protein